MKRFAPFLVFALVVMFVPMNSLAAPPVPQSEVGYLPISFLTDLDHGALPGIMTLPAASQVNNLVFTDIVMSSGAQEVAFNVICPDNVVEPKVQQNSVNTLLMTRAYESDNQCSSAPNMTDKYGAEQAAVASYSYSNTWKAARDCI